MNHYCSTDSIVQSQRYTCGLSVEANRVKQDNGYPWISVLVNVPATIFATGYYEFLMRDSLQKIQAGHAEHEEGEEGLQRHLTNVTSNRAGAMAATQNMNGNSKKEY